MLTRKEVLAYTKRLDTLAGDVQENWREYGLNKKAAFDFCLQVDTISDRLEKIAGVDKRADVLEQDADEPYLKYYDIGGVINPADADADEKEYMDEFSDDTDNQFEVPQEGETSQELKNKASSTDYWNDREASGTDYWDDSRTASDDYWG